MDLATISVIATAAISFLSAFLQKTSEASATKIGEDLYQILKTRFGKKPAAQEALTDLEKTPGDTEIQTAFRVQLKKLLAEDESFAIELQELLKEAEKNEAGATIIKQAAGDNAKQFGQVFGNISFGKD